MTEKQFISILSPVQKLANVAESINEKVTMIYDLTLQGIKQNNLEIAELKKQTVLLADIRNLIKEQVNQKDSKGSGINSKSKIKMPGIIGGAAAGVAIVVMAASLVAAAGIFSAMPSVSPKQLLTAIAIGLVFTILTPIFVDISKSLRGGGLIQRIVGKKMGVSTGSVKDILRDTGGVSLAMIAISVGILASSLLFSAIKPITLAQFATATLIGIAFIPISFAFGQIVRGLQRAKVGMDKEGFKRIGMVTLSMAAIALGIAAVARIWNATMPSNFINLPDVEWIVKAGVLIWIFSAGFSRIIKAVKGTSIKDMIFATAALPLLALSIVGVAKMFEYLTDVSSWVSPPVDWTLKTGLSLAVFGIGFSMLAKTVSKMSVKELVKTAAAVVFVALAIVGTAWIFQHLIDEFKAPPVDWTLKAGLSLAVFGIAFVGIAKILGNIKIETIVKATLTMVGIAIAILATAWIFSYLPDTFLAPDMGWSLSAMASIILFAIPVGIIGAIIKATGGGTGLGAIALGVIGMIIIAAGILAIAWIFSFIPADKLASVAKGLTQALLAPLNGIVDVLARIKNEIGVESLIPLAIGIIAISVSLITLAAATASVVAGGLFNSIAGVGKEFFGAVAEFFGGKRQKGPLEILTELVGMAPQIGVLATSLGTLSSSFVQVISQVTESNISRMVRGVNAFILTDALMKNKNRYSVAGYFKAYPAFLTRVASGYNAIAKAQSKMDIQVLEKTTEMIKALAYLNEVGGDNAMAKLGDALVNAVKELAGMLKKLSGDISEQTAAGKETSMALNGVANRLETSITPTQTTPVKPTPQPTTTKDTAPTKSEMAKFNSDDIVDAIEELQRIVKTQKVFI